MMETPGDDGNTASKPGDRGFEQCRGNELLVTWEHASFKATFPSLSGPSSEKGFTLFCVGHTREVLLYLPSHTRKMFPAVIHKSLKLSGKL